MIAGCTRSRVAEPPQHLQPPAHRLDARADPLERQRLPRREQHDRVGGQELAQVVVQLPGVGAGRRGDHQRMAVAELSERGDRDGARRFRHGDERGRVAERLCQPGSSRSRRGSEASDIGHR